jgi:hypothetical protein
VRCGQSLEEERVREKAGNRWERGTDRQGRLPGGVAGSRRNEEKAHIAEFTFWSLMAYGDTGVAIAHRGQSPAFPLGMRLWFQVTVVPE